MMVRSFGTSSAHRGMWLAQQMSPETPNHALTMWEIDGELDAIAAENAFLHVLGEAEVLRVTFRQDGEELRLVPRGLEGWRPFLLDLRGEDEPERAARRALAELVRQPFDLSRDLLFRMGVVVLGPARSLVVIAYHHLVSDGFGIGGLFSRRLAEVYSALVRGTTVPEPPHPWDAESFAAVGVAHRESPAFAEDTDFWREHLADGPPPAQVPRVVLSETERAELAVRVSDADRWSEIAGAIGMVSRTLTVPRAEADGWIETARSLGIWVSTLFTAATAVYLRHRCDRPEFVLSLAVGNRVGAASRTPGLAVNVVPVRLRVPLGATFSEVADAVVDESYEVLDHAGCHYSDIQRATGTVVSGRSSFGTVVNVVEFVERLHFGDSPARYLGATTGTFDELSVGVYTDGTEDGDLFVRLDAPAALYSDAELRFIGVDLLGHVRAAVADVERPVGALDGAGGTGRDRTPSAEPGHGSATSDTADSGETVPELIARRARRHPDAVAVESGPAVVSYGELDDRANRLARSLRRRGVGPESVVVVALPRSPDLAVTLLAVARSGGASVAVLGPPDPTDPTAAVPPGCSVTLIVTEEGVDPRPFAELGASCVGLDELRREAADEAGGVGPAPSAHPDALLAVVPHVAPDGRAAGVAVTHRAACRLARAGRRSSDDAAAALWHSPPTSPAFALELWAPLLHGGRVVVADGHLDADALVRAGDAHDALVVCLPSTRFASLAAASPRCFAGLRDVCVLGDRIGASSLRRVREACPDLTVVEGPPSAEAGPYEADPSVVGGAVHVLGPGLAPVPAGVTGELYVEGPDLVRGWTGLPATTAQYLVPCPSGPPGGVMYRTGERGRRGADGRIDRVGGTDGPARVRGFTVEPVEVEEVLAECAGVAQAVVVAAGDGTGQQRLVAHVVAAAGAEVTVAELRRAATGRLPEFMVPSVFAVIDRLPETLAHRVDRAELPEPRTDDEPHRAPRNRTERVLAAAFADVLERERVGIDDDFFDLGGNSLRAIRLVGLIRAELSVEVAIRTLFVARSVQGLSAMWDDLARSSRPALRRRTRAGAVLAPAPAPAPPGAGGGVVEGAP